MKDRIVPLYGCLLLNLCVTWRQGGSEGVREQSRHAFVGLLATYLLTKQLFGFLFTIFPFLLFTFQL